MRVFSPFSWSDFFSQWMVHYFSFVLGHKSTTHKGVVPASLPQVLPTHAMPLNPQSLKKLTLDSNDFLPIAPSQIKISYLNLLNYIVLS